MSAGKTAPDAIGEATARLLLEAGAVQVSRGQPFVLAAGWASPVYVDCRLLIGQPSWRQTATALAAAAIAQRLAPGRIEAIAGAETAGIAFAAWLADRLELPLRYVRKRPLGIGHNAQVEGGPVDGLEVLLMDDLTTDAASKVAFARGLRAAGATVTQVLTIFYHQVFPGAAERLAQDGLTLHALAGWDDVLRADRGEWLAAEDRREIERFLADPIAWSTRHGGRSAPGARQPVRRESS
ncbi:orotate phosphoribosyltransferase [Phreatobacter stygius]|uniref:Orotate phosphoribosyltransferase n=1 Tax=Phreatobacter stygius TaxID=1940610 RepID=A0A4D7B1L6_9HYPH|nr:orotate phosphoribosyltransferase [Phreatobacter stygius]QCI67609.1 orotate phosphoribosyltransferase [Phreatobacter stygius]